MKRDRQRGFSLLEMMIVVTIILILSAITVPTLLRARQSAYEASAAGFIHTVQTEQVAYRASHGSYATSFSQLGMANPTSTPASGSTGNLQGGTAASDLSSSGVSGGAIGAGALGTTAPAGGSSTIIRNSYIFTLTKKNEEQWDIWAAPILDRFSGQYFYTDESGALRSSKGAPPSPTANSNYAQ
jgi:prepilin-type N-terminal cleavage/methylation domain-containing protein